MLGLSGLAALVIVWGALYGFTRWLGTRRQWRWPVHRDVIAVGVLIAVTLGFYWPLFFTESWIPKGGGDLASFIYPTYAYGARWLKRGVVPLWNPHLYMGMPFAADNQSGLFYPVNLLFFMLTPELSYEVVELMGDLFCRPRDLVQCGAKRRLVPSPFIQGSSRFRQVTELGLGSLEEDVVNRLRRPFGQLEEVLEL